MMAAVMPLSTSLYLQAEKALPQPVRTNLLAYCPTMDLVAIVTKEENVEIWRLAGQRAFQVKRREPSVTVAGMCWNYNGGTLIVAWSDCKIEYINTYTAKRSAYASVEQGSTPSGLSSSLNFLKMPEFESLKKSIHTLSKSTKDLPPDHIDVLLDRSNARDEFPLSLPNELALLSAETDLPRLSVLPALPSQDQDDSAIGPDAWQSQASVDSILTKWFVPSRIGLTLVCTEIGELIPLIYQSLSLGPPQSILSGTSGFSGKFRHITTASHPKCFTHNLLLAVSQTDGELETLLLRPFSIRPISAVGQTLYLIASKFTHLQNLEQYLIYALHCAQRFYVEAHTIPQRLMRNISETLAEKEQGDLQTNLYALAVTGHCPALLREWLTDELAERGHKRWDAIYTSNATGLIEVVHENILPALDRVSIVASELRGICVYYAGKSASYASLDPTWTTAILRDAQALRRICHAVLSTASRELRQFKAFEKWLRYQIDVQAAEKPPNEQEAAEKESELDYPLLLAFIAGPLSVSHMQPFFDYVSPLQSPPAPKKPVVIRPTDDAQIRTIDKLLREYAQQDEQGATVANKGAGDSDAELLKLSTWHDSIQWHFNRLGHIVVDWLAKNTHLGPEMIIDSGNGRIVTGDARMEEVAKSEDGEGAPDKLKRGQHEFDTTMAFVTDASAHQIHLRRVRHRELGTLGLDIVTSDQATHGELHITLVLPMPEDDSKVTHLQFADAHVLLVLYEVRKNHFLLLSFPYSDLLDKGTREILIEEQDHHGSDAQAPSQTTLASYVKHDFGPDHFTPSAMSVNGRIGRRVVCVLDRDGRRYRVYDLDVTADNAEGVARARERVESSGSDDSDEMADEATLKPNTETITSIANKAQRGMESNSTSEAGRGHQDVVMSE